MFRSQYLHSGTTYHDMPETCASNRSATEFA